MEESTMMEESTIARIDERLRQRSHEQLTVVLDFVSFLATRQRQDALSDGLFMAETALRKDWDRPEEDGAWANL